MQSLLQASRQRGDSGKLLPPVWRSFEDKDIRFRRGQLYLIVAGPGSYKSTLAQSYAIYSRARSLYLLMDADRHTTCVRVVQAMCGIDSKTAEHGIKQGAQFAANALKALRWVKYSFPSGPDVTEIVEHVWAYAEMEGDWPEVVFVDNLDNVDCDDSDDARKRVMLDLQKLAHKANTAVVVLHHATGQYEDGDITIPMSGVLGKVSKTPSMILTLNRGAMPGQLWVSVVKNRFGPADTKGIGVRAELYVAPEFMHISDPLHRTG